MPPLPDQIQQRPGHPRSFYFLGKIHEERGEMDEARNYYWQFVEFWDDGDLDRDRVEEARSKI